MGGGDGVVDLIYLTSLPPLARLARGDDVPPKYKQPQRRWYKC